MTAFPQPVHVEEPLDLPPLAEVSYDRFLMGFLGARITAEDCWQAIDELHLWPSDAEIICDLAHGRDVARVRANLSAAPTAFKDALIAFVREAEKLGAIGFDERDYFERLCGERTEA